jgi:hypothetical protein
LFVASSQQQQQQCRIWKGLQKDKDHISHTTMLLQVSSPSRTLFSSTPKVFLKETMIWKKKTGVIQERKISRYYSRAIDCE